MGDLASRTSWPTRLGAALRRPHGTQETPYQLPGESRSWSRIEPGAVTGAAWCRSLQALATPQT